jgi:polyisoprenoid-binding protein YceI
MRRTLLPALSLLAVTTAAAGAPVTYTLDPAHSFVHFEVLHFGTSTLRGRFGPLAGTVTLDRATGRGDVGLRIATAGVDTGVAPLDARLRAPDLFDTAGHPEAFFVATQFRFDGERLAEVRGEFTLRGRSEPLSLKAMRFACRVRADDGREVCGGDFEAALRRSDFGMTFGLPFVADAVRLVVQVEGVAR